MEVVKTLMGIIGNFKGGKSVTPKFVQKHFPVSQKQWPNNGEVM